MDKQRFKQKHKQKMHGFEGFDEQLQDKKAKRKKRMADHADRDRHEPAAARRAQAQSKRRMRVMSEEDDYDAVYEMRHANRKSRKDEQKLIR